MRGRMCRREPSILLPAPLVLVVLRARLCNIGQYLDVENPCASALDVLLAIISFLDTLRNEQSPTSERMSKPR